MVLDGIRSRVRAARDSPIGQRVLSPALTAARRLAPRLPGVVTRHAIYRGPFALEVPGGRPVVLRSHGHLIENQLFWYGLQGFDPESTAPWLRAAREARVVLDIGANTGLYGLLASAVAPEADVHFFEPVSRIAALARSNIMLNKGHFTLHQEAASDVDGTATLFDPGGDSCYSASLVADFRSAESSYDVVTRRVDSMVESRQLPSVDLVKIDVEGHEARVLRGMRETIRRHRPTLLVEFLPSGDQVDLVAALGDLIQHDGYQLYHLGPDGPARTECVAPSPCSLNVLLMPGA